MAAEELVALAEAALGVVPEADARELLLTRLVMDRPQRSAVEFVQSYMAADDPAAAMLVRVCRGAVGVSMHGDRLQPESHRLQSLWVCTCHPAAVRCWCVCKAGLWGTIPVEHLGSVQRGSFSFAVREKLETVGELSSHRDGAHEHRAASEDGSLERETGAALVQC